MFYSQRSMLIFHPNSFILFVFSSPYYKIWNNCLTHPKILLTIVSPFIYLFPYLQSFLYSQRKAEDRICCIALWNRIVKWLHYWITWYNHRYQTSYLQPYIWYIGKSGIRWHKFRWANKKFMIPISWTISLSLCHSSF